MRFTASVLIALAAMLWTSAASAVPRRVEGGIEFSYSNRSAGSVSWAGDFNGWNATATPLTKDGQGIWRVVIDLPPGEHQYKFVVDGQWFADPDNPVTGGDFGNSVVTVGADGSLVEMQATSNTPYNPQIFVGGRIIGLFIDRYSEERNRFELRRPNMDVNLDLNIRIASLLRARFLMDITSEAEDVEFFRSSLNFNRGNLHFDDGELEIFAYDNEDAGTWDDPLHLVGNVGIYDYAYGYGRQGFRFNPNYWGFESELHYADNFEAGGTTYPPTPDEGQIVLPVAPDGMGGFVLQPGGMTLVRSVNVSDANEDMFAFNVRRPIGDLRVGILGRGDRGFNLSGAVFAEATGESTATSVGGQFEEEWFALGADARWGRPGALVFDAGYLRGTRRLVAVMASRSIANVTVDSTGATVALQEVDDATGTHYTLDDSNRLKLGGAWTFAQGDITVRGSVEYEDHAYSLELDGVKNTMTVLGGGWDRNWRYYLDREVRTSIDVEYFSFDYDARTPWRYQLWFPTGNFWLEHGEHEVSYDRMTMLGVADVWSLKPRLEVPIYRPRNVLVEYAGVYNLTSLSNLPKYAESTFKFGIDVTQNLRFSTDHRWAKYDDPNLGLFRGYLNNFFDLTYSFATDLSLSLSWGVDPYVLDPIPNEYRYIGRDLFLFDLGANGSRAETNYFSLGSLGGAPGIIDLAEEALEKERRLQVEAIVRF